jgi:hypothetical protein
MSTSSSSQGRSFSKPFAMAVKSRGMGMLRTSKKRGADPHKRACTFDEIFKSFSYRFTQCHQG